jgi:hypothetical protein
MAKHHYVARFTDGTELRRGTDRTYRAAWIAWRAGGQVIGNGFAGTPGLAEKAALSRMADYNTFAQYLRKARRGRRPEHRRWGAENVARLGGYAEVELKATALAGELRYEVAPTEETSK